MRSMRSNETGRYRRAIRAAVSVPRRAAAFTAPALVRTDLFEGLGGAQLSREAANKRLGSAICIGPGAARYNPDLLRPLGTIEVRSRDEKIKVFEPWPDDAPQSWRERYLAAFHSIGEDALQAAALFQRLAEEREDDPVGRILADRLRNAEFDEVEDILAFRRWRRDREHTAIRCMRGKLRARYHVARNERPLSFRLPHGL
jgi:hypothetical protein